MDIHLFFAFCLAFTILAILPGPIVTLVVANSLNYGTRSGLATVTGANVGNTLLLGAIAVGLVTIFSLVSEVFVVVRWIGAGYLIWLRIPENSPMDSDFNSPTIPTFIRPGIPRFIRPGSGLCGC
ncbi:LysE family translocator [Acidiphilium multivorum]|uniref:LysE family translocator n=1 Tax=Acidiphilium multivorum TaxID=62140 RepID=UPI001F4C3965|nr:LysE family translocator [Acidiphilium multivorum]